MKCFQIQISPSCFRMQLVCLHLEKTAALLEKVPPGWCGERRAFIICSSGRPKAGGLAVMAVPRLSTSCAGRRPAVCPVALKTPITLKQLEK